MQAAGPGQLRGSSLTGSRRGLPGGAVVGGLAILAWRLLSTREAGSALAGAAQGGRTGHLSLLSSPQKAALELETGSPSPPSLAPDPHPCLAASAPGGGFRLEPPWWGQGPFSWLSLGCTGVWWVGPSAEQRENRAVPTPRPGHTQEPDPSITRNFTSRVLVGGSPRTPEGRSAGSAQAGSERSRDGC